MSDGGVGGARVYTSHTAHTLLHVRALGVVFALSGHRENILSSEECRRTGALGRLNSWRTVGAVVSAEWKYTGRGQCGQGNHSLGGHIPPHPVNMQLNESS